MSDTSSMKRVKWAEKEKIEINITDVPEKSPSRNESVTSKKKIIINEIKWPKYNIYLRT